MQRSVHASPLGSAIFTIISAVAQLEKDIIAERVKAGLRKAKEKGTKLGRPRSGLDLQTLVNLRNQGRSLREISRMLGIPKSTVADSLKRQARQSVLGL